MLISESFVIDAREIHVVIEINKNIAMRIVLIDDQSNTIFFEESIQKKKKHNKRKTLYIFIIIHSHYSRNSFD